MIDEEVNKSFDRSRHTRSFSIFSFQNNFLLTQTEFELEMQSDPAHTSDPMKRQPCPLKMKSSAMSLLPWQVTGGNIGQQRQPIRAEGEQRGREAKHSAP